MARRTPAHPKDRILDAAEDAFAESGFAGASMRQIVAGAGVNLATVYYYFGSKEGLLAAVFTRRFEPLKQEHLRQLQAAQRAARDGSVAVDRIVEAMVSPALSQAAQSSASSRKIRRLIGRIVSEPNPQTQELLRQQFGEVRRLLVTLLRQSLPKLPAAEVHWRLEFIWGALAFVLCNPGKIEAMSGGLCNPLDTPTVVAHMRRFFGAGLRAPSAAVAAPKP